MTRTPRPVTSWRNDSEKAFTATVEQVARRADVSAATVYAIAGGKAGLISSLVQEWADSPVLARRAERLTELSDPMDVLRLVAASRQVREEHGDVMRVLLSTAAHDPAVADGLAVSTARYREAMRPTAQRLHDLGSLAGGPLSPRLRTSCGSTSATAATSPCSTTTVGTRAARSCGCWPSARTPSACPMAQPDRSQTPRPARPRTGATALDGVRAVLHAQLRNQGCDLQRQVALLAAPSGRAGGGPCSILPV